MGYQHADLDRRDGYVVASKVFVPITTNARGQSMMPQYYTKDLAVRAPTPKFEIRGSLEVGPAVGRYATFGIAATVGRTSISAGSERPENETYTEAADVFYRISAYPDDRRIRQDGSLAPESYATTETDITVVPSGLAAVGRFALPTRISARHVFRITPGRGVKILYGTVIPNYGLCGGGVEVYFPDGTGPRTVSRAEDLPEK